MPNYKNYSYAADLYEKVAIRTGEANDYFLAAESLDIAENYIKSLPLYEKAAQLGHSKAKSELPRMTYNVGCIYYNSKNYSEALKYYKKASDMGYANAANNIGVIL